MTHYRGGVVMGFDKDDIKRYKHKEKDCEEKKHDHKEKDCDEKKHDNKEKDCDEKKHNHKKRIIIRNLSIYYI